MDDSAQAGDAEAALAAAQALARKSAAPATLRAYKADWTHYATWCVRHGFVPVPAAPETVGAYLASMAGSHAPSTVRRRLSALGKMHRFNDLPWNPGHRDIQGPLQGLLRTHGRPPQKAAALTLPMLSRILATCDQSARGRRDRALLLFGFAGALRCAAPNWWRCRSRTWRSCPADCACASCADGRDRGRGLRAAERACATSRLHHRRL
jgi:site-specific recombinase XerD